MWRKHSTVSEWALRKSRASAVLRAAVFAAGLTLVSASLIFPKILVIAFVNQFLWGEIGSVEALGLILQDAALALGVFLAIAGCVARRSFRLLPVVLLVSGSLLLLLMLDARARQVWLKPSDVDLIRYGLDNSSSLTSGLELFFNRAAGLGMTFRRVLVVTGAVFLIASGAVWATARSLPQGATLRPAFVYAGLAIPCLIAASKAVPGARYGLDMNILADPLARLSDGWFGKQAEAAADANFEQRPEPLSNVLRARLVHDHGFDEERLAKARKTLKNVVIVFLESMRWRDVNLDVPERAPATLARFAREGAFAKAYVSVPHSSKAYFAVLTGRNPYPGIEMREVLSNRQDSIVRALQQRAGLRGYAFSSMALHFENVDGMLRSLGVEIRLETAQMLARGGRAPDRSSFGSDDGPLYGLAAERLAKERRPFAAILFPQAAHYPYNCEGSSNAPADHNAYLGCIAQADRLLSEMLTVFGEKGLLQDTLFVLVGDHGEAFGEHGVFAHNSSVFEEEVAVPLLFWTADGSLALGRLPDCRQIDIAPTIADLFGVEGDLPVQGQSLLRLSKPPAIYMSTFFDGSALALLEPPVKFIYEPATERLVRYDLAVDPFERRGSDVVDPGEAQAVIGKLRAFQAYHRSAF